MRSTFLLSVLAAGVLLPAAESHAQALRGSRSSVQRIYQQARDHDLTFFRSGGGVREAAERGDLVRLVPNADFQLHQVSHPYVLPTTRTFVTRLAAQYRGACGEKLVVTSGTRPTSLRLANSVDKSVHPTGMAVDIRRPTKGSCQRWLRSTLIDLNRTKAIEAVEERRPPHFHIAVFPRPYLAYIGGRGVDITPARASAPKGASAGSRASAVSTYRVRKGDSLWTIARRHDTTVGKIRRANGMQGSRIKPGQVLSIPEE